MVNIHSTDYSSLFSRSQYATLVKLEGKLKDFFLQVLLPIDWGVHVEVAMIALDIIKSCDKKDHSFQKKRDRFFTECLTKVNLRTKSNLEKVLEVSKKGFFENFINHIDCKKKEYHPSHRINLIIDKFHSQIFPELEKESKKREALDLKDASCPSLLLETYDNLVKCRAFFSFPKLAYEFLDLLQPTQKLKKETYEYFFHLLNVEYNLHFEDFEKVKLCQLIFSLHSPLRQCAFQYCSKTDLKELVNLCFQLKYQEGEEVLSIYFFSLSLSKKHDLDEMIQALHLLLLRAKNLDFYTFIEQWSLLQYDWSKLFELLENDFVIKGSDVSYFQDHVDDRLERFKSDSTITYPLSDTDLKLIGCQYRVIVDFCKKNGHLNFHQLMQLAHQIREVAQKGPINEAQRLQLIGIGSLAIRLELGFYPYSTQILALLALLVDGKSRQGQVKTGEGKSLIIALWAFVMAMECRAVDIITSARYLAIRDHDKFAYFFQRCEITTGHICYDEKLPIHFTAQILYGPAFDFEFAWMEDLLHGSKLYQKRLKNRFVSCNFDACCVDESDNLLIDSSRNGARIAYPSEESFDWAYAPILLFVRQNKELIQELSNQTVEKLKNFLNNHFSTSEKKQKTCRELSDEKMKIWLKSAYHVLFELTVGKNYVVHSEKNDKGQVIKSIRIVDISTGRVSENSRWSNGIHEFLEVKHDITVEKESLTAISLSHSVFYMFYKTISALTGTAERFQTREIYQIHSFDVPPHRPVKRKDFPIIIKKNHESFFHTILEKTKKCIQSKRPILVLCKTIYETQMLAIEMEKKEIPFRLLNEVQEESEHIILSQAGASGKVTIATNTAGRGTDIILTDESLQNGGLHVLLTFYPDSEREEYQAIGRAGRQGQPGSSQMILNREDPEIEGAVKRNERKLSDSDLIQLLSKERDLRRKAYGNMHLVYADLERFLAQKTHHFYGAFRLWVDHVSQDSTLERFAEKLYPIKLRSNKTFNFENLNQADLLIAKECQHLLMEKTEMLTWKIFLQKVIERLKKKVIEEWVTNFFEPTEKHLKEVGLGINVARLNIENFFKSSRDESNDIIEIFFSKILEECCRSYENSIEKAKLQIDHQFKHHLTRWEEYLDPKGFGLFIYLKELDVDLFRIILR